MSNLESDSFLLREAKGESQLDSGQVPKLLERPHRDFSKDQALVEKCLSVF